MIRCLLASLVVSLATASAITNVRAEAIRFPSTANDNAPAGPSITAWVYRPAANGPAPAVIYEHTCGGLDAFSEVWARRLASWGYFVITPDSYGPRGLKNTCTGGMPPNNLVADLTGALDFLAGSPDVIKGKVAVLGNSAGGKVALRAVQRRYNLVRRGLLGGVGLYLGTCSADQDKNIALPFLALLAEKDDWMPMADCHAWVDASPRPPLEAVFYPDAQHGFDNSVLMNQASHCSRGTCHIVYDAKISADAEARVRTFLQSLLGR